MVILGCTCTTPQSDTPGAFLAADPSEISFWMGEDVADPPRVFPEVKMIHQGGGFHQGANVQLENSQNPRKTRPWARNWSGKGVQNYGKSPSLGKSTISMVIFNSKLLVITGYQSHKIPWNHNFPGFPMVFLWFSYDNQRVQPVTAPLRSPRRPPGCDGRGSEWRHPARLLPASINKLGLKPWENHGKTMGKP